MLKLLIGPIADLAGIDKDIVTKSSRAGTFDSITFTITATGTDQLEALHKELVASGRVSMVI